MTSSDRGPVLYFKLNELDGTQIQNASETAGTASGTVGNATLVADDLFGSCLQFDGGNGAKADLGQLPSDTAEATACLWIKAAGSGKRAFIRTKTGSANQKLIAFLNGRKLNLQIGNQPAFPLTTLKLSQTDWTHVAVVLSPQGGGFLVSVFVNGTLAKKEPIASANASILQKRWMLAEPGSGSDTSPFAGKLAHVRIYDRALAPEEVRRAMETDRASMPSFQSVQPVDFELEDDDQQGVLYIVDPDSSKLLHFHIRNASNRPVFISKRTGVASPDNYHVRITFRPGSITGDSISVGETDWSSTRVGDTLFLLYKGKVPRELKPTEFIHLTLNNLKAAPAGGSRGTRIEVLYQKMGFTADDDSLSGRRVKHLDIVNQRGRKEMPLRAKIVGSRAVLNDGMTDNSVELHFENTLDSAVELNTESSETPTTFSFSFETDDDTGLTTPELARNIAIEPPSGWTKQTSVQGTTLVCDIINVDRKSIPPEGHLVFKFSMIRTSQRSGEASIFVRHQNLPGYWDSTIAVTVDKQPLVFSGEKVGIGTTSPQATLHVEGDVTATGKLSTELPFIATGSGKFKVAGDFGKYYPIAFQDDAWRDGELVIQLHRPLVHADVRWRGSLMARLECHSSNFGNGSGYWRMSVRQYKNIFIGGVANVTRRPYHIVWLRGGDTTYSWNSNHPASVLTFDAATGIASPTTSVSVTSSSGNTTVQPFPVKSQVDPEFNRWTLHVEQVSTPGSVGDTGPVGEVGIPRGSIVMWSGAVDEIPVGWALCNGKNGTPDLQDRFLVGAGKSYPPEETGGEDRVKLTAAQLPSHKHTVTVKSDGDHSHRIVIDTGGGGNQRSGRMYTPGDGSSKINTNVVGNTWWDTNSGGGHAHSTTVSSVGSNQAHENRPKYYALCFIMKR